MGEPTPSSPGVILWMNALPAPCPPDVQAWSGRPPGHFFEPARSAGFELIETSTPAAFAEALRTTEGRPRIAFIYSLRPWHYAALLRHGRRVPFVLYYQNVWPEHLPFAKRLAARLALRLSSLVLLQDRLCLNHFRPWLGERRTLFFPWHVDEAFFDPTLATPAPERAKPWLFIPGDRARLDDVVLAIARRTGLPILRVSRFFAPGVIEAYQACPNVEVKHFVPWATLRDLYGSASVVLNVADDRETSAGMTTFLEALAMNARVITPAGHSSSGYTFADGHRPYGTVAAPHDVDAWVRAIDEQLAAPSHAHGRGPRDLFLHLAGRSASEALWREIFARVAHDSSSTLSAST